MARLVVRNLEAEVKRRLRQRAARHGRSMEEEVRHILGDAVRDEAAVIAQGLGSRIAARFASGGLAEETSFLRGATARPAGFDL